MSDVIALRVSIINRVACHPVFVYNTDVFYRQMM